MVVFTATLHCWTGFNRLNVLHKAQNHHAVRKYKLIKTEFYELVLSPDSSRAAMAGLVMTGAGAGVRQTGGGCLLLSGHNNHRRGWEGGVGVKQIIRFTFWKYLNEKSDKNNAAFHLSSRDNLHPWERWTNRKLSSARIFDKYFTRNNLSGM